MIKFLQLFADDEGGTDTGNEIGAGGEKLSFDDFLKDKDNQAEFDRRVSKAISTAIGKEKSKWEAVSNDKLSEAEKLAKMTKEEQSEYRTSQLEKELAALKKEKAKSELTSTARKMLADEDITVTDELLTVLVSDDAETTKNAINGFATLFKSEVEKSVKEVLKGTPPKAAAGKASITKGEIMSVKDRGERQRLINENIELFQGGEK